MITSEVENYPGFADGVLGPEMMDKFEEQAERSALRWSARVTRVDFSQRPSSVWTADDARTGQAVIVATGASAKWLGLPNEERLQGRGVSGCATCDGFFFRGKDVTVVGGGDTAMEEALFLTSTPRKVHSSIAATSSAPARSCSSGRASIPRSTSAATPPWRTCWVKRGRGRSAARHRRRARRRTAGPGVVRRHRPPAQHRSSRASWRWTRSAT